MRILEIDCTLELKEKIKKDSQVSDPVKFIAIQCDIGHLCKVYRIKDQEIFFPVVPLETIFLEF